MGSTDMWLDTIILLIYTNHPVLSVLSGYRDRFYGIRWWELDVLSLYSEYAPWSMKTKRAQRFVSESYYVYISLPKMSLIAITRLAVYMRWVLLHITPCVFEKRPSHYRNAAVQPNRHPIYCLTQHGIERLIHLLQQLARYSSYIFTGLLSETISNEMPSATKSMPWMSTEICMFPKKCFYT